MADMKMADLAKKMKDIDFTMLYTRTEGEEMAGRPMSNNREVEYDGDSFYFAFESARVVQDIRRTPKVGLCFQGSKGLLGKPPLMISVEGDAELLKDRKSFEEHWTPDLERWFKQGVDTPGLTLIKVHASRIHYWDGEDQGDLRV